MFGEHYYGDLDQAAFRVAWVVIVGLCAFALWQLVGWLRNAPHIAKPWSADVADKIASDETSALCHRCLAPHDPQVDFCPDCGATVGTYTNWLPYPYIFSLGHTLRVGTDGAFRRSPVTVAGFVVLALCQYAFFAPVYLFVFFRKLLLRQARPPSGEPTE